MIFFPEQPPIVRQRTVSPVMLGWTCTGPVQKTGMV